MSRSAAAATKASSFAVTCNLLSQYIKEKGRSFGDLDLDALIAKNETHKPPTTMSLLPGVDVLDRNSTKSLDLFPQQTQAPANNREPEKSQLTIFYGGKVLVFDNFSADKAKDLMMLAGKSNTANASEAKNLSPNPLTAAQITPLRPAQAIACDLPIARKASLHRFLEKRKDRINAKAPYQVNQVKGFPASLPTPKSEENQPWLQLKPSLSSEGRR